MIASNGDQEPAVFAPVTGSSFARDDLRGGILRSFLRGAGYSASFVNRRPVVGICTSWSDLTPCNLGLRRIAESVKRGVVAAGGFPLEFSTISLSESTMEPATLFLRNLMSIDVEQMITRSPMTS